MGHMPGKIQLAGRDFRLVGQFRRTQTLRYQGTLVVTSVCGCFEKIFDVHIGPRSGVWIYDQGREIYELCCLPGSGRIVETFDATSLDQAIMDRMLAALTLFLYRLHEDIDLAIVILPIYTTLAERHNPPFLGGYKHQVFTNYRFQPDLCHWEILLHAPHHSISQHQLLLAS